MTADLIARAQTGDGDAFGQLIEPYRREFQLHCYRILGSVQDAEDALQETLLAAWRGLDGFEGRSSVRTWLYKVATSRCLNALRSARRRNPAGGTPREVSPLPGVDLPPPTRLGEVVWLDPYPDLLLEGLADSAPGPEARYEASEAISLAFITVLQLAARFLATVAFRQGRTFRLVPTRANGQLALAAYLQDPDTGIAHANSLLVLALEGGRIGVMTRFDPAVLPRFGLPLTLPG